MDHRFQIFEKDKAVQKPTLFRLEATGSGGIDLVACDEDGEVYQYIVGITRGGRLLRYGGLDRDIGIQLDANGEIELTEEFED